MALFRDISEADGLSRDSSNFFTGSVSAMSCAIPRSNFVHCASYMAGGSECLPCEGERAL